jgi:hypothetical protein
MAKMKRRDTRLKIEKAIEDRQISRRYSRRLGPSAIGGKCARATWYKFRWASRQIISPRQKRLFSRGDREEPIVLKDLESVGVKILSTQEYKSFCNGHACAFSDGRIIGIPDAPKTEHLLEIKTANKKRFEALLSCKSFEKWDSGYYDQIQVYMDIFGLTRCLVIVASKDDDRRYYERVKYDQPHAKILMQKFNALIYAKRSPQRNGEGAFEYPCIFCDYQSVCWTDKPDKNCRTCRHLIPVEDGEWKCLKKGKRRSIKKQHKACGQYRPNC